MTEQKPADPSQFADPALRQAVQGALGGSIRDIELDTVKTLHADGKGIRNLNGIQRLSGLTYLSLQDNEIESIAELGALRQLETLRLRENPLWTSSRSAGCPVCES